MASTFSKSSVSSEWARALIDKAEAKAAELGVPSTIVVADESGTVKALSRMDGASLASVQVATDKAYSAASTGAPTEMWYGVAQQDPSFGFGLGGIDRLCMLGGGLPIMEGDAVVGGLGVSGGTVEQDLEAANAALEGN